MIAPPSPCAALAPIRKPADGDAPHAAEEATKIANPPVKTRRRPTMSESEPAVRTSVASASAYASTTHWSCEKLAFRSCCMSGSATWPRYVKSSETSGLTFGLICFWQKW